jgi:hypothetical protein
MPLTRIQSLGITDGTIVNADINASAAIAGTKLTGVGISEADMWRITATKSLATSSWEDLTANWERADTLSFNLLGTGMTQSSGIFTFPSTGYYLITMYGQLGNYSNGIPYTMLGYDVTTDNSNYTKDDGCQTSINGSSNSQLQFVGRSIILDVTSTSNVKIKFSTYSAGANTFFSGSTSQQSCGFLFIKLGDT